MSDARIDLSEYIDLDEILETGQCEITGRNMAALILALQYPTKDYEELKKKIQ